MGTNGSTIELDSKTRKLLRSQRNQASLVAFGVIELPDWGFNTTLIEMSCTRAAIRFRAGIGTSWDS